MYKATDIANFLVYLMSDSCDDLTNLKLNKILYYAQGHYLKNFGVILCTIHINVLTISLLPDAMQRRLTLLRIKSNRFW